MSTAGPAHRVQSAVVEYGFPQGHLGHLTGEEEEAFKNFKALCQEKGYYNPGEEGDYGTHDDATLLRFLRARRFVVPDAFKQFQETEDWRKENELDKLYETIDLEHYEETRRLYPQWTGRRDRRGIPVYVFEVKHLNSKTMSAYEKSAQKTHTKATTSSSTSPKLLRLFALYENLTRFVMPLCTALTDRENRDTPITQSNNIVDISGVGLKQFWNLRGHMQDASTLATAHYPETLDRIFIIGAPAFFPTVWGWIKKWFDPITTSKIFILSSYDMKKTLESFIDPANIPKKYGGQLEFEFGDHPVWDPEISRVTEWMEGRKTFPEGPLFWADSEKGKPVDGSLGHTAERIKAVAVGSTEGGKERREDVCVLTRTLPSEPSTVASKTEERLNGHVVEPELVSAAVAVESRPELLNAPTEEEIPVIASLSQASESTPTAEAGLANGASEKTELKEGNLVSVSTPEPTTFHTASESLPTAGITDLSLSEKAVELTNEGPHSTNNASLLDPSLQVGEAAK
ncbi:CRAL-TRIO domain-containing protein [Tricladium varicosporioides]|nr:CRAL-TRIO domain-containing protein [Hymenoscyphus varicosporioides]